MATTEKELTAVKKVLDDQSASRGEWLKQVRIEESEVSIKTRIGMGSYAEVYLGDYRGARVAVKQMLREEAAEKLRDTLSEDLDAFITMAAAPSVQGRIRAHLESLAKKDE